ncbi:MAG: ribulose-phosphate 3-epimerase [Caldilineales bacterium]|nr:ribulose-phosphate 3-epimerase [Caldilineales bacterium]
MNPHIRIAPSMMCADLWRLAEQTQKLEAAGVELLHFDLMDAHFVPNMPLGLGMLEMMRARTGLPFDAHLMVENNDFFIEKLAAIGVQMISVHAESARHLDRTLALIQAAGAQAGVALNPATPLSALDFVLERLDYLLIMTVNPGFAAQKLVPSGLRKLVAARAYLRERGLDIPIQADGNVSFANIPPMVAAGADILVGGTSSVFHKDASIGENVARARVAIAEGLRLREEARP